MINPTFKHHTKPLMEALKARGVIILAFDGDRFVCSSYGETKSDCEKMGNLVDQIAEQLDNDDLTVWD